MVEGELVHAPRMDSLGDGGEYGEHGKHEKRLENESLARRVCSLAFNMRLWYTASERMSTHELSNVHYMSRQ